MQSNTDDPQSPMANCDSETKILDLPEDGEVSEGEVMEDDSEAAEKEEQSVAGAGDNDEVEQIAEITNAPPAALFEVRFFEKTQFQLIGYRLLQAIKYELNNNADNGKQYKIDIVENEDGSTCLTAHEDDRPVQLASHEFDSPQSPLSRPPTIESSPDSPPDFGAELRELFTIDTNPSDKIDTVEVPSYKRAVKEILDHSTEDSKKVKKEEDPFKCVRSRPGSSCFNCGESGHGLRDCPKPRNNQRINRAKLKMLANRQDRYHIDVEQRFAHLRPGVVSQKLRDAMGLQDDELPFFFYRMRNLGYPPGWLEDAKVEQSGMYLIDSESKSELNASESHGGVRYDSSKIHDFPGFNCWPGPNYYDDYKYHRVSRFNKKDFKDEFIKSLGAENIIQGYRRKKLKDSSVKAEDGQIVVADMEIEDEDEQPATAMLEAVQSPQSSKAASRPQSPSLEDLEDKQRRLMEALQTNVSVDETAYETANGDELPLAEVEEEGELDDEPSEGELHSEEAAANPNDESDCKADTKSAASASPPQTPVQSNNEGIKNTLYGTPLLKFSPFDKLPAGDNFKSGVSDVINFENLPDSTGKYEQMRNVIKKVRKIITQLNDDNE